jgi:hypothetical protein
LAKQVAKNAEQIKNTVKASPSPVWYHILLSTQWISKQYLFHCGKQAN